MKTRILSPLRPSLLLAALITAGTGCVTFAAPPVVSNVTASQRAGTKLVDITYNVSDSDGDLQTIGVEVSGDGGLTYTIPATALSGHVGAGIAPGSGRSIVWNAGVDWNGQYVPTAKVRITAFDGTTPPPPPGFVYIPAGSFQMGDNFNELGASALPVHNVQVDGFFMERFEVTRELVLSVQTWAVANGYSLGNGNSSGIGHPAHTMSWYDVVKWCNARSEKEGRTPVYYTDDAQTTVYRTGTLDLTNSKVKWNANGYRLPTEAEWEKAARGGALGLRYPWGNTASSNRGNFFNSGDPFEGNADKTTPVGYYDGNQTPAGVDMANGYGLYDMAGNVWEWCWDVYDSTFYGSVATNNNPRGPASVSGVRCMRGAAWDTAAVDARCAFRGSNVASLAVGVIGFRCARGL
jgi:formylglycine-generating enzyme required for sulfatase activity